MDEQTIRKELLNTACKQLDCFERLIELSEEQKSMLMSGKHDGLAENLSRFDPLLLESQQIAKRGEALRQKIDSEAQALSENGEYERQYGLLKSKLTEQASKLRILTETNHKLLNNAMEYVGFSMSFISKIVAEEQAKTNPRSSSAIVLDLKV